MFALYGHLILNKLHYNETKENNHMNYAEQLLRNDRRIIEIALDQWTCENYPEAKKVREKRLKEINRAIELIENDKLK